MGRASAGYIHQKGDVPGSYHIKYSVVYKYFGFREIATSAISDEFELLEGAK